MVGETVEQRGGLLRVFEDGRPLLECQVGGDDDGSLLVELADQMDGGGSEKAPPGLLKKSFHAAAGIWGGVRFSMIDLMNCRAAASFLRFIATAVRRAWIFMFSSPLRMAQASPWSVVAVPFAPSTRQRWRGAIAVSASPDALVCARGTRIATRVGS